MSMKIDGNRLTSDVDAARKADAARTAEKKAETDRAAAAKTDRVEVSKDAQLMTSAVKAAQDAPAVRHDVVERMRKALEAGEIGQDSGRLADRLIDSMLNK
jgi:flagellar biosynthesis anti-sigma factor FlgM